MYNISNLRKSIEKLYDWTCDIVEYSSVKDDVTKISSMKEVTVFTDIPCKISFKNTNNPAYKSDKNATASQDIKLIINPDINIKEGSKIIAKKDEKVVEYSASSISAIYSSHQEIPLKKFMGWL